MEVDEIIVQIARALACRARLRILSRLVVQGELAPSVLARELELTRSAVAAHLRRLAAAGLIERRQSGAWSYVSARAPTGGDSFSERVAGWLVELLRDPGRAVQQLAASGDALAGHDSETRLHAVIFQATTAFTHIRRLRLLRCVSGGGELAEGGVRARLKMSKAAFTRAAGKLVRRGYVVAVPGVGRLRYRIATAFQSSIHWDFLGLVEAEWIGGDLGKPTSAGANEEHRS